VSKKIGIKAISMSCGVLPHTLRIWEHRYKVFNPERAEGGARLYTPEDLKKAKLLSTLISYGHSISNLAKCSLSELEQMTKVSSGGDKNSKLEFSVSTHKLIQSLSLYKLDQVVIELDHLRLTYGAKEFIFEIILPTMREIGLLVSKGKYSITQEHIISTLIREQISQIHLPNQGSKNFEMILATPEENWHELSIMLAQILCRINRISTCYLGAAHPAQCLAEAMNALDGKILVLGVVNSDQWNYEEKIFPYLKNLDKFLNHKIKIILGGGKYLKFHSFKNINEIKFIKTLDDFDSYLDTYINL